MMDISVNTVTKINKSCIHLKYLQGAATYYTFASHVYIIDQKLLTMSLLVIIFNTILISLTEFHQLHHKILSTSEEVDVVVLEVDPSKRRISLGLKQTLDNPWNAFADQFPVGATVEGEVKNKTEFGLFVGLEGDVDGMVHLSDLDWNRPGEQAIEDFNKGDAVQAVVLDVDVDKERISLGIKQLSKDNIGEAAASGELRKNAVVSVEVTDVQDTGLEVKLVDFPEVSSYIRRSDLSRDRDEQRPERFSVGQTVDARVTNFSKKDRKVTLSIKALEIAEEKQAVEQFGSSDSGASLGDILGAALKGNDE